jgi:hypothetical protein
MPTSTPYRLKRHVKQMRLFDGPAFLPILQIMYAAGSNFATILPDVHADDIKQRSCKPLLRGTPGPQSVTQRSNQFFPNSPILPGVLPLNVFNTPDPQQQRQHSSVIIHEISEGYEGQHGHAGMPTMDIALRSQSEL